MLKNYYTLRVYVILYHKSNSVYTVFYFFSYFVKKLKILAKILCKLNCSYGKVSNALKLLNVLKGMW